MRRSSSAERLRSLRLVLTLLFAGINLVSLVVFAFILVRDDQEQGRQRMEAEMYRTTSNIVRLLDYDPGKLYYKLVQEDDIDQRCPKFAILPVGAGEFTPYLSSAKCVVIGEADLAVLAENAARSGNTYGGYHRAETGELVFYVAQPFQDDKGPLIGAVVAWNEAESEESRHDRYTLLVVGGCALFGGALTLAAHVLSGRAIRPAAAALEQQEVLLAETAHDLRTPVAALRALAETALQNPTQRADLLPRTVRLAARMGSIIDGLLVRARLAAGVDRLAIQPVWLDQLVTGVVQETPTEGAQVTVTAAPSQVMVDPTLVQRAVGNLLDNALRYGRKPDERAIVHITVANGRVVVADHGPGIDPALAEEVFDRFRTGSGSSGLGLSIVRWVAQAHGGSLDVHNAEEGGAIFELVLPIASVRR